MTSITFANLSSIPAGANLVTADGTPLILDGTQFVLHNADDLTKDPSPEAQLRTFWLRQIEKIRNQRSEDLRHFDLPLARIKKIMKLDEDVGMISSEAPVVLSKACEIFIEELTLRAWLHVEENKRRTLQRNDVASAISKCDQFDFLIDIVPREEAKPKPAPPKPTSRSVSEVQYFVQQGGQINAVPASVSTTIPVAQVQGAVAAAAAPQSEAATLPVMINNADGQIQQANLTLSAQQIDAIRNYISHLGIPISNTNQIVIQAPTAGGSQLQVSINPNQLQQQESSDSSE